MIRKQNSKVRFSIRYKFLLATCFLLVLSLGVYLLLATNIFSQDKTQLIYELNKTTVTRIASDVESLIFSVKDKVKIAAHFSKQESNQNLLNQILNQNSEIVFIGTSNKFKKIDVALYQDNKFLKTYGLDDDFLSKTLLSQSNIPMSELFKKGEFLWNAGGPQKLPLMGYAQTIVETNVKGEPVAQFAIISLIKTDKLIQAIAESESTNIFLLNGSGEILISDAEELSTSIHPLYLKAKGQAINTEVSQYKLSSGQQMLGAYSKSLGGQIIVVSEIEKNKAYKAVYRLMFRTGIFTSIILTLAFIVAIFFSRSFTRPLERLLLAMEKVAQGDLSTQIDLKTRDEISVLANSFNKMICDLANSRNELQLAHDELEEKVIERTRQLEEKNLAVREAQEALIKTSKLAAVGEIAGQTAHEVLNPLTGIMSRIELVKKRLESHNIPNAKVLLDISNAWQSDINQGGMSLLQKNWQNPSMLDPNKTLLQEDLDNVSQISKTINEDFNHLVGDAQFVLKEGSRINRILNTMRSMSRVEAELSEQSLHKVVIESINVMSDLSRKFNTRISFKPLALQDKVFIDRDEFIQCLTNIIRNSLQSIEDRRNLDLNFAGSIEIWTEVEASNIFLYLLDNGSGIETKNHEKLFEKNFSTKTKSQGTGLGLKITRRIIRAFHGDVTLHKSELGKGSCFKIQLPLSQIAKQESA